LVPQRAVTRNAAGQATAYFVTADNKAELRTLVTSGSENNDWIVISGIKDGDRLVVDGLQKIREGGNVKALDVTIDDDGVIKQTIAPAAAEKKS
jgi:membrane fusion protein (multidrug efflux system)